MAGNGMAPKATRSRARDTKAREAETQTVVPDGELHGPELPEGVLDDESWHPRTVQWWNTWRRSAQSQTFTETDWDFLIDTALMHHTMWAKKRWEFAAELRLRAAKFGATPEDRQRLKLKIGTPTEDSGAASSSTPRDVSSSRKSLRIVG